MKLLLFTDVHWSEFSSILRTQGTHYSKRLELCINSMNWLEKISVENHCDMEICLGDFFDKPELNSSEITALADIQWNNTPKYFLIGNHEASTKSLQFNSVNYFKKLNFNIVSQVSKYKLPNGDALFIPYFLDEDRKTIADYKQELGIIDPCIVISHNDVKGISFGRIVSPSGIEVSDIETNCKLFINGHLHNGTKFCKNGINLGNFVGQNFSEDGYKYKHCAYILDTETFELTSIENPYSSYFYQIDISSSADIHKLDNLANNAIVSIKCDSSLVNILNDYLKQKSNIITSRITEVYESSQLSSDVSVTDNHNIAELQMDHLTKFAQFCKEQLDNTEILDYEIASLIGGN